jgi:hypothetical protein
VLGGVVVEGEQSLPVLYDLGNDLGPLRPELLPEKASMAFMASFLFSASVISFMAAFALPWTLLGKESSTSAV